MSDFCRQHAYYDCPICAGEKLVWVIPIMDGNMVQTGEMRLSEDWDSEIVGTLHVPWEQGEVVFTPTRVSEREHLPVRELAPRPGPSRSETRPTHEPPDPALGARLQTDFLMAEPRYREAIARGRKVHEDALALSKERGIPYAEAIQVVIG